MKTEHIIFMILFYVAVIGSVNWGFHAAGFNLVEKLANLAGEQSKSVENGIYYFVAFCGLVAGVMYTIHIFKDKKDEE